MNFSFARVVLVFESFPCSANFPLPLSFYDLPLATLLIAPSARVFVKEFTVLFALGLN